MKIGFCTGCVAALFAASVAQARTVESFNDGWSLTETGKTVSVSVPHDWAIAGPFEPAGDGPTGKLRWFEREGVYRRTLVLPEKPKGRVFLDFDGVMCRSTVFVNRQPCGKGDYGYLGFRADATPYLLAGTNLIEVACSTKNFFSRWYPGGGLYRNTWMVKTDPVYFADDSLRIETKRGADDVWTVTVSGVLTSRSRDFIPAAKVSVALAQATESVTFPLRPFEDRAFSLSLKVTRPRRWQLEPGAALYDLTVSSSGGGFSDALVRRVGFREFRFDAEQGFILNGKRVQLNGVDLHSDLGPLGMAFDKDAMRRQLSIMRDMGANALRTSHNCPAPEVLDLCDEMGFFVWNECFDKWNATCGHGDEPMETFVSRILAAWVRRDRTHPSVFCWSIGNEISPGAATPPGQERWGAAECEGTSVERCARFREIVRREDATRPVAIGSCFPQAGLRGDYDFLDLTGWNYRGMYDQMKLHAPDKPIVYSESASAFSDFGYYAPTTPTNKLQYAKDVWKVDSYDLNASDWSDIPDREFFRMERDRYCCGEFVWTGIDYLGEPSPYIYTGDSRTDSRSSYFGICDLCALPKDRFYLYRSHWNRKDFTLHIVPAHWTFPEKTGKTLPVFVYTSASEAELFVNGKSMGRRKKNPSAGTLDDYYSVLPRYRLIWKDVPYAAGEVKAVAYGAKGEVLGTETLKTAGKPVRVVLTPEKSYGKLTVVVVSLADCDGTFVPNDNRRIAFAAEGCEIAAVGNSDPRGLDSFKETSSHPLCFGRAAVYVRGTGVLRASADGLMPAISKICRTTPGE